jgi:hypothetical protein
MPSRVELLFWLLLIVVTAFLLGLRKPVPTVCSGPVDELFTPCVHKPAGKGPVSSDTWF